MSDADYSLTPSNSTMRLLIFAWAARIAGPALTIIRTKYSTGTTFTLLLVDQCVRLAFEHL